MLVALLAFVLLPADPGLAADPGLHANLGVLANDGDTPNRPAEAPDAAETPDAETPDAETPDAAKPPAEPMPAEPVVLMSAAEARRRTLAAVEAVDSRLLERAAQSWATIDASPEADAVAPAEVLEAAVQSFYLASEPTRELLEALQQPRLDGDRVAATLAELAGGDPFVATNVRAWLGRQLAVGGSIDEAALLLEGLSVRGAIDPVAILFYQAVCHHNALEKDAGLAVIDRLLELTDGVPQRYRAVARLMRQDLEDLADNDMAQVAHQMKNVQRRLQQGRSGEKTQEQEQRILGDLDRMIEKMEQQLQQMQGQQPNGTQPDQPLDDSRIAGGQGEGEVDEKNLSRRGNWGNLPEKERTAAKDLIRRQFPSHYRQAVEEYLKRLAERPVAPASR